MGGMVAYFVSHILQDKFHMNPDHLFIGGCPSPKYFSRDRKKYIYDEIVDQMIQDNRITQELAASSEFNTQIYPIIENDYNMLIRNFDGVFKDPLSNTTVCISGLQDTVVESSDICDWSNYISRVVYRSIDDEHYFNESSASQVCDIINRIVCTEI